MQFLNIIGQERLIKKLIQAARTGRVSHAQLFTGVEGRGALAVAVAYSQYINCENPTDTDSCGTCHNCRKYNILQHPDLHFAVPVAWSKTPPPTSENFIKEWIAFFAANQYPTLEQWHDHIEVEKQGIINVAESENIIRTLNFKPYEAKYKVQIIWHAERMHDTAANKLLKLIEEPPANTLLILITQSPDSMLKTIVSRTQQVAVPPIEPDAIAAALTLKKHIPQPRALEIAHLSCGDYAEALNMTATQSSSDDLLSRFASLMRICTIKNKEDKTWASNTIALLMWADEMSRRFGREEQKNFLSFSQKIVRESFMFGQKIGKTAMGDKIADFAGFAHCGNAAALYDEFNLAYGQIAANGNARIIFTDLALNVMRHVHAK